MSRVRYYSIRNYRYNNGRAAIVLIAAAVVAIAVAIAFVILSGSPHSSDDLTNYHGQQDTVVLTAGQQLALNYPQGRSSTDWVVTYDGTTVHIDETNGLPNSHYQGAPSSDESHPTEISLSGWDALSTAFYTWNDPDQDNTVVVEWPYGWNKE